MRRPSRLYKVVERAFFKEPHRPVWHVAKNTYSSCNVDEYTPTEGEVGALTYRLGEVTGAVPDSLGVFCFTSKKSARVFMRACDNRVLLFVKPLGDVKRPMYIGSRFWRPPIRSKLDKYPSYRMQPHEGTVTCPGVEVLREVEV